MNVGVLNLGFILAEQAFLQSKPPPWFPRVSILLLQMAGVVCTFKDKSRAVQEGGSRELVTE